VFNEGYSATAGDDWVRPQLCEDALRLGRVLAGLTPEESEVHGLVALMEIQASRLRARVGPNGEPVLLLDQDRARWDRLLIRRGLAALARSEQTAAARGVPLGPYALQAAIAACHARARLADETDWRRIARLYDALGAVTPSPIVELNRAAAIGMAESAAAGLAHADALRARHPELESFNLLHATRAELLVRAGRLDEAAAAYDRALALAPTEGTARADLTRRRATNTSDTFTKRV